MIRHLYKLFIPAFLLVFLSYINAEAQFIIRRHPSIDSWVNQVNTDSLKAHIAGLTSFHTRHTGSQTTGKLTGIDASRDWVLSQFRRYGQQGGGRLQCRTDTFTLPADGKRLNRPTVLGNVMAFLPGTESGTKRLVLISGHLDSRVSDVMNSTAKAPGANDDGSGVAAVMECARLLAGHPFPYHILFVAVSGEEQGLLGSNHLAGKLKSEGYEIIGLLNNDIMGSNHSHDTKIIDNTRLRVFSEGLPGLETASRAATIRNLGLENDGASRQLARYVKETGETYVDHLEIKLIYRNDRFLRGGDHTPFVNKGLTAVRITEMNEDYTRQHQDLRTDNGIAYGDVAEAMDFEYLRKNTAVNLSVLASLALAPPPPVNAGMETKNLTNFTTLQWDAPGGQKPAGYYVLVRETSEAQWQKKYFTTDTRIQLPLSKDNYFFGIQSANSEGICSLPVVPEPIR